MQPLYFNYNLRSYWVSSKKNVCQMAEYQVNQPFDTHLDYSGLFSNLLLLSSYLIPLYPYQYHHPNQQQR